MGYEATQTEGGVDLIQSDDECNSNREAMDHTRGDEHDIPVLYFSKFS